MMSSDVGLSWQKISRVLGTISWHFTSIWILNCHQNVYQVFFTFKTLCSMPQIPGEGEEFWQWHIFKGTNGIFDLWALFSVVLIIHLSLLVKGPHISAMTMYNVLKFMYGDICVPLVFPSVVLKGWMSVYVYVYVYMYVSSRVWLWWKHAETWIDPLFKLTNLSSFLLAVLPKSLVPIGIHFKIGVLDEK